MALNSKTILVDDLVLEGIMKATGRSISWRGTMTDLDAILTKTFSKSKTKMNSLPGSPSALRVVINRITNRLRIRGISVRFFRSNNRTRTRFVSLLNNSR